MDYVVTTEIIMGGVVKNLKLKLSYSLAILLLTMYSKKSICSSMCTAAVFKVTKKLEQSTDHQLMNG